MDERRLRRAGLDYREWVDVLEHQSLEAFMSDHEPARVLAFSKHADRGFTEIAYESGDGLLFGPETRGLPDSVLAGIPEGCRLRIPMLPDNRSLNLSNAVAVACYEAWRQHGFGRIGTTKTGPLDKAPV